MGIQKILNDVEQKIKEEAELLESDVAHWVEYVEDKVEGKCNEAQEAPETLPAASGNVPTA